MIFLALAWFGMFLFFVLAFVYYYSQSQRIKSSVRSFQLLLIILMTLYAIIGIATKDPLSTLICEATSICVPAVAEWVIYIGVLGILVWKFILVDMKTDIRMLKYEGRHIRDRLGVVEGTLKVVEGNTQTLLSALVPARKR